MDYTLLLILMAAIGGGLIGSWLTDRARDRRE